ncbi:DNA alkylation repair protein [Streptococcus pneumoniae]|nr:DNA alkylation repair protein [Streptococcus pneumoniae]MBS0678261.1 DNA alkylation repair protein [Streptococcus pneumoniae]RRR71696.1 DNA alkylation repair protein [Streptococcus pneumoniae]RRR81594.1 DNA alkylation repair protein [Streptococcus pneumoniae]RRR86407.1 DNA alkylation repair protein [Streptococcus pneumoniae]
MYKFDEVRLFENLFEPHQFYPQPQNSVLS